MGVAGNIQKCCRIRGHKLKMTGDPDLVGMDWNKSDPWPKGMPTEMVAFVGYR